MNHGFRRYAVAVTAPFDPNVAEDLAAHVDRTLQAVLADIARSQGVSGIQLRKVDFRPMPAAGKDVWVHLPAEKGAGYRRVGVHPGDLFGGIRLSAEALMDLRERGVCIKVKAMGNGASKLEPADDLAALAPEERPLQPAELLADQHGFAVALDALKVFASESTMPELHCWLCIRMPD